MSIPRIAPYEMPREFPKGKVAWRPEPTRAALLVHDLQQYFLDFYDPTQPPVPELLDRCARLIAAARTTGIPVFYTAQPGGQAPEDRSLLNDFWGEGIPDRPESTRIVDAVTPQPGDTVLTKCRYSAFKRSDLEARLRGMGRDQLLICGVYAHIGCLMTAAEAFMLDIQPFLIGDALADFSREDHEQALHYAAGRCARVCGTEDAVRALTGEELTLESLRVEIAEQMGIDPGLLGDHDDLLLMGLDSVNLMMLMERWRQRGWHAEFADLVTMPTLAAWHILLGSAPGTARAAA
jgi:bifunctional isochorismate lyase/aryl carrier protein